jgi:hypothetical protein
MDAKSFVSTVDAVATEGGGRDEQIAVIARDLMTTPARENRARRGPRVIALIGKSQGSLHNPCSYHHRFLVLAEHPPHGIGNLAHGAVALYCGDDARHEVLARPGGLLDAADSAIPR